MDQTHPVWVIEYIPINDPYGNNHPDNYVEENGNIYVDVIDAEEKGNGQRFGTICLGLNAREDPWVFICGKERITHHFLLEVKNATKDEETFVKHV